MFHGTGPAAIEALEGVVLSGLVQKPNLTLLQLQAAVGVLSDLATEEQLAAVALLLRGGFWMSALQVGHQAAVRQTCVVDVPAYMTRCMCTVLSLLVNDSSGCMPCSLVLLLLLHRALQPIPF
jgi:hypothetical protein